MARAKLLQVELERCLTISSRNLDVQLGRRDASLVKKLQDLVKTFPESVELRGMLLRAEDSLERAERARYEAAARASAIDLEIKAYSKLLETGQSAKALAALEESAAKYPESDQLQSLLLKCREQIAVEQEARLQAIAHRAAIKAAIDKGNALLKSRRYDEAGALLEAACQQWPEEKQLEKLLSSARKSIDRQTLEQQKREQQKRKQAQLEIAPGSKPRRLLLISAVVASLLLVLGVLALIKFVARPHLSVLTVESLPSGAEIEVDGRKCITPHCSFKLSPGAVYNVTANLKGYVPLNQSVTVTNDQAISFELAREAPPSPPSPIPPVRTQTPAMARLVLKGVRSGDQLFVDDVRLPVGEAPGTWDMPPGPHRLRLMAGTQELVTDPRQFKANATLTLNRADFRQPAPATSQEQVDWKRLDNTTDVAALEEFLHRYPDSSFRSQAESKLEDLYWSRATSSGSLRAFQGLCREIRFTPRSSSPGCAGGNRALGMGIHPRTQPILSNSRKFLDQNPRGEYHDRAENLLDDLTWAQANRKGDSASLKGYLSAYPSGRHKEEAVTQIARLTPAPVVPTTPAPIPPAPPVTPKIADDTDDLNAIHSVLESYKSAYDTKNVEKLQELWPDMSPKQVNELRTAFRDAGRVKLTYTITKGPEVAGNVAVVSIEQQIMTNAAAKSKVTMALSKDSTHGVWHITSIR